MKIEKRIGEYIQSINQLKKHIYLAEQEEKELKEIIKIHPIKITEYYFNLIDKEDPNDPIKRIVIPSVWEKIEEGEYDTSGEAENTKTRGLQHKYDQTALILATNRCASYCRNCFRKRLVGLSKDEILKNFDDSIKYIQEHVEINNVLVTGGDPFSLETRIIREFLERLDKVNHLDFIRFGTRVPVVLPQRISEDQELLNLLEEYSRKDRRLYIITHFNHPREITKKSAEAIEKLMKSGVIANNQTVLLRGVNDNSQTLAELQNGLAGMGVNPYYVFQCRPVKRVKTHMQVPLLEGYRIVEEAKNKLDGHSKRFRYVMSHKTGKVEMVGIKNNNNMIFKYHQAKNPEDLGKILVGCLNKKDGWLDDVEVIREY